jgi:outer membrane protein assembly complex protein YaeT
MFMAADWHSFRSSSMLPRFLLALILCLIAKLAAPAATSDELDPSIHYQTAAITISGNHNFSDSDLLAVMRTQTRPAYRFWQRRPPFNPATFKADLGRIKSFYRVQGYYSARVDYNLTIDGKLVSAKISLSEGQPVKVNAIRTVIEGAAPAPKELEPSFRLPLRKGTIFTQAAYQLGAAQLLDIYMRHGYAHAKVNRRARVFVGPGQAEIWYLVIPGSYGLFGKTVVTGVQKVSPELVFRQLTYKPGETFDSSQLVASRSKIVGLNLFRSVELIPQANPNDPGLVPIEIRVRERPKHSVNFGVGYNTQSQFLVGVQWNDYNFWGNGRQLSISARYSNVVSTADLKLIQPFFFSPKATFTGEASAWQEVYQTYTLNAAQAQPRLGYRLTPQLTTDLGWRLAYLKFNSLNPQTIAAIGGVRPNGILSGPSADIIWNNTEDPFNPQHGEIATLYANTASHAFGSDYRYWRVVGEVRKYHLLGWRTVLAGRLELGFEHSYGSIADIPLSERFYSGGEGSIRGYGLRRIGPISAANQPLGGLSLVESSLELRRPLFWRFAGSLFFDCGQVSKDQDRVPVDALQCGAGPGISINTPVGPMLGVLGFPTEPPAGDSHWQLYFSIGQWF